MVDSKECEKKKKLLKQMVNKHDYPYRTCRLKLCVSSDWQTFKHLIIPCVWEDVEQRKLFMLGWRKCKLAQSLWRAIWQCEDERNLHLPLGSASESRTVEKMRRSLRCSIVCESKTVEAAKCPSVGGWIDKWWYIHTMEFYATLQMPCWVEKASCTMILCGVMPL